MRKRFTSWDIFWTACILVASAYLLFLHVYNNKAYTKAQIDKMFAPITTKYGIRIVYEVGDDFFSNLVDPIIPAGPDRHSKVTPIRHRVLARYPRILKVVLGKYPVEVIKKYLNTIQFAGEIDEDGFRYSGTYDPFRSIVYLVDDGSKDVMHAMSTFHHEFSSLLLKKHSFYINPWEKYNPNNFKYLVDIYKNWEDRETSGEGQASDYEKGFVTDYGQTDFENDFNEYSAMIFTYPDRFKKIMNQYPRVRGKFLVWLEFYHQIDPIFTEEYLLGNE